MLHDKLQVALTNQDDPAEPLVLYLFHQSFDGLPVIHHVFNGALEIPVAPPGYLLNALGIHDVLDVPVVHLLDHEPPFFHEALKDGIRHPQGETYYPGKVPLGYRSESTRLNSSHIPLSRMPSSA